MSQQSPYLGNDPDSQPGAQPASQAPYLGTDPDSQPGAAPAKQPAVMDVSGVLAKEGVSVVGHDSESGLPLIQNAAGQTAKFDMRAYAKAKYGAELPEDMKFQYNTAANPVQAPVEPLLQRIALENVYDDKSKLAYLASKYGEVIPDTKNGIIVNNNGVYQTYDPKFINTGSPRDFAEGFAEQLPRMVGPALADAAAIALVGNPVGLAAIGGTALAAGLTSGTVRTALGAFLGTNTASAEDRAKDIGLEGLVNMAGGYIPLAAKGGWGVVSKAMGAMKDTASEAVQGVATSVFGKLTGAGDAATSTLIQDSPGVIKTLKTTLADAGGDVREGVNLATQRAADTAKAWLKGGVDALPAQFKAGMEDAAAQAEDKGFKANVSDIIAKTKSAIQDLNFGKFADTADADGVVKTVFKPLSEADKTALGVADPAPGAMDQIQRITKLLGRYANDGELEGSQAFNRLANLNKELNQIKYGMPQDATPELNRAVTTTIAAFKNHLGQEFTDQGLGEAWIAANKPYIQYSKSVDQARDLLNSKDGIYTFLDRIGGKAGKLKSAYGITNDINALTGDSGEALYDQMMLHQASSKFMKWEPQLGAVHGSVVGSAVATGALLGHPGALAVGAVDAAASSPRLVANGINAATAPGRAVDAAHDAVLPFIEKFQDYLRNASPVERKVLLQNPAMITEAYNTLQQSIMSVGQHTQGLIQGAQKQIQQQQPPPQPQGQPNGQQRK